MLASLGIIFVVSLLGSILFQKIKLPGLIGMLLAGILVGPAVFNWLDDSLLANAPDLKRLALVIVLLRAGLSLKLTDLFKVGRPALLLSSLPALLEIVGAILLVPWVFGFDLITSLILGSILAAVSPAVVVPKMIELIHEKRGTAQRIPQMILAGAAVDDVLVIVLFTAFIGLAQGEALSLWMILQIPFGILIGVFVGHLFGTLASWLLTKFQLSSSAEAVFLLGIALGLVEFELYFPFIPYSGYLAVMALGLKYSQTLPNQTEVLNRYFSGLWQGAQLLLFSLVGASIHLEVALSAGLQPILLIAGLLIFRTVGVLMSLLGTNLTKKEKLFIVIAYLPKATIQATIGSIPLSLGLPHGEMILTVAVIAILLTAPLGAIGMELTETRLLIKEK